MRLFKRRCSDPSPQLVSLSPICQDAIHEVPPPPPPPTSTPREAAERLAGATMSASRRSRTVADRRGVNTPGASSLGAAAPSPKSARKGLSTWGKKVGRKWEQLKRSDSAELLAVTPGRRRHWSPNKSLTGRRRISRVESLRNLFARNVSERPPTSSVPTSISTPEISSSCTPQSNPGRVDKETSTDISPSAILDSHKEILDLYKLNSYLEQNPNKAEEILDFLSQSTFTFEGSEFDKETITPSVINKTAMNLTSTPKNTSFESSSVKKVHFPHSYIRSRLTVLPEEQIGVGDHFARVSKRRYNRGQRTSSSCDDILEETMKSDRGVNTQHNPEILLRRVPRSAARSVSACGMPTPVTMEDLCLFLNLLKSDESGYDSDSTRTGSDSPRSSIKSGLTEQLLPQRRDSITIPEVTTDHEEEEEDTSSNDRTLVNSKNEDTCIASDDEPELPNVNKPGINATDEDKWTATLSRQRATRYGGRRSEGLLARKHLSMSLQALDGPDRDIVQDSLACNECVSKSRILSKNRHSTSTMNLSRNSRVESPSSSLTPTRLPAVSNISSPKEQMFANKEFKVLRLTKDKTGELGIFIKKKNPNAKTTCYVISHIAPGGLMDRDGRFKIGDEIVNVDGRRLRGMTLSEARTALRNTPREVEIVVARDRVPTTPPTLEPPKAEEQVTPTTPTPEVPCTPAPTAPPVTGMRKFSARRSSVCGVEAVTPGGTLSRRPKSLAMALFTVTFEKGPGKKSLGFSVVGGKDSPKGSMGIFVKTVFQTGQAAEEGSLREGDEILSVNGQPLHGLAHSEAIALFKNVKSGTVLLHVGRRDPLSQRRTTSKSKSCDDLDKFDG